MNPHPLSADLSMIRKRILVFLIVLIPLAVSGQTTLYTYQSGNWSNIDVWTTDPGGTTLTGSKIPGNNDIIIVLPSRTLSLSGDIGNTGLDVTIREGGILDAAGFKFTSVLAALRGQGVYRLRIADFPSATVNAFVSSGGGTVEYYNSGAITLPVSQATYNNLIVNCSGTVTTQLSNITVNNDLRIQSGTFKLNDATAARRTLIIYGNVKIDAGAAFTVGIGNTSTTSDPTLAGTGGTAPFLDYYVAQSHRIEIYGDLTNDGTLTLTNQAYPVFNSFPSDGFASVFFRGATDNTITCNGTTDFYNLIVDKGADQTFVLSVNSSGYDKFRLFGANNAQELAGGDASNPDIRKALWIRNGTLRLNGFAFIPSLTEGGGDFFIPGNGALLLGGPDVVVCGTIDDYSVVRLAYNVGGGTGAVNGITTVPSAVPSSLSLYGKLQINEGKLYMGEVGRIIYYGTAAAQFIINGGIIDIKQFQSVSGGGKTAFWQTSGNLILRGRFGRTLQYTTLAAMISSIGDAASLNTARVTGTDESVGTLDIDQDANIFHMEGGNISVYDVSGTAGITRAVEINSEPSNVSVTGGNINVYITSGTLLADADYGIASKASLYNLSITRVSGSAGAVLRTIPAKTGVTAVAGPPLKILNNLLLANRSGNAAAVLNSSGYDVKVGGNFTIQANAVYTPGNNRTVLDGAGAQSLINSGTITSGLHRFVVDKTSGTATLGSNLLIRDSLVISGGTINDGGFTLQVAGNIYYAGSHTGTGKIILNGSSLQTITAAAGGSPVLGNVDLQNATSPAGAQLSGDASFRTLTLTANTGGRSIFDIKTYNLNLTGGIVSSNGTLAFGATKMILTAGNSSDKGLTQYIALQNINYTNQLVAIFPLGIAGVYYPAEIYCNGNPGAITGSYTIIPVYSSHPATDPGSKPEDVLPFYWRSKFSGFTGLDPARISQQFYHASIATPLNKAWYLSGGEWIEGAGAAGGIATFTGIGFPAADYTAGKNSPYRNPTTFYSRQSGLFNLLSTWSIDPVNKHSGAATTSAPQPYDIMVIGGVSGRNDSVTVTAAFNVASITINGSYTGNDRTPVLNIQTTTGHTIDIIRGNGKFCSATATIPVSDYGELLNSETGVFQFYGAAYTLPATIVTYPNLLITGGNTKTLAGATVVRKKLMITDATNPNNALILNSTAGDLTVYGDVKFRNGGKLYIPVSAASRNINIYGNIDFKYGNTSNANSIEAVSGAGTVHKLNFYGSRIFSGASNFNFNPSGTNRLDLYLKDTGSVFIDNGTGTFSLNKLFIHKNGTADTVYFKNNFTLNETDNATASRSLNLTGGILVLSDPLNGSASTTNLNLSKGGADYFNINSASGLILRNGAKVNISGNTTGSGIHLDGLLQANENSEINLADGSAANTGYIEYSGSGNAKIVLSGSSALRAAQVRRSLYLTTGLLSYTQGGSSSVTIYGTGTSGIIDPSRAKLEVTGTGSSFSMSGNANLNIQNGGGTTFGDLYLRPGTSSVTGGNIIFGTGTGGQTFRIDASVPLNNLTIDASGTANDLQIWINPLVLNGNLVVNNSSGKFTSNNIGLTIKGNLVNNGTFNAGTNTTIFSGSTQSISGTSDPAFYNLTLSPSVKIMLNRDITVNGSLNITGGTLETTVFSVRLAGNVSNNGSYTNSSAPATSRLFLNGSVLQHISGTGSFGRIEIDNPQGARLDNNLSLSEDLTLTNGVLDINQYSLTFGPYSFITSLPFDASRMIRSDGVYSNGGIIKHFNAGFSGTFRYPSGVSGKYTPVTLAVNATNAGYVRINVINSRHPATLPAFNVLNYYWDIVSDITGFDGNLTFQYAGGDIAGTESQYVAARLIIPPGTGWSKAAAGPATDNVNEAVHTVYFSFPAGTSNLGGQYTAGITSCLPNTIPVYTSNKVYGAWDDVTSWSPAAPAGGPNGFSVIIKTGNTIYTNGNRRFAFKTTINGTLEVGTSYGHNLGTVDGTGTLFLSQANLPAGDFGSFLSCPGGTLEYGGNTSYTIVADRIDTVKNLYFTGTGTRTLPDKDLMICNQLLINGPALDNHFNRRLSIGGSFDLSAGSFSSGTGAGATVAFNGTAAQTVAGFRSANPLNNLEITNPAGLTLNSAIMMKGNLLLINGVINTTADSLLKMISQPATVSGGSSSSYVNGPMSKNQLGGVNFEFPLGKSGRLGRLVLVSPQTGTWEAEYYNSGYTDQTVSGALLKASAAEYWRINSPANGKTATVKLRWDSQGDITPVTTTGGISDIRVAEYNGADWIEKTSAAPVGNDTDGTVQTSSNIPVNNSGHPRFYTLGSVSSVKPTIMLGTVTPVSRCILNAYLPYTGTTGNPDQYMIDFDAAANSAGFSDVVWTALTATPIQMGVPGGTAGGSYNAVIRVRTSSPLITSIPYPFTITITSDYQWTGALGTDWNAGGNWACGSVPGILNSVHIPNVGNKPVLSGGAVASVNNLTIESGSSLTVSGNTLQIAGTITNAGIFNSSNGKILLNGSAAQVIGANVFAGNSIKDLTVNNPAGVTLQGPLIVTGILLLQNGNLASAGNLTLASSAAGTASVDGSGAGDITGNVTMQRYLSSGFGYKYFSSPFQLARVSEFGDDMNLNINESLDAWNENRMVYGNPGYGFYNFNNPTNVLAPLAGYAVQFGNVSLPNTVDITGVVNNGSLSVILYNHNQTFTTGFNLVGNPYPSPINWNAPGWTKTNIDDALYFYRTDPADQYGGTYSTYINGLSNDGNASNIIQSMQGFFIHVKGVAPYPVAGLLGLDNSVRINNNTQAFLKKSAFRSEEVKGEAPLLRLTAAYSNDPSAGDHLLIYMDENATPLFDSKLDAVKFFNVSFNTPNLYAYSNDGTKLTIDALPFPEDRLQDIPLGLNLYKDGEIVFRIKDFLGIFPANSVSLYDGFNGEVHDLLSEPEYRVTLNAGDYNNRFWLNFGSIPTESNKSRSELPFFKVYTSGGVLFADINCVSGTSGLLTINNLTGQAIYNTKVYTNGHFEYNPMVPDGIYIVSFVSGNFRATQKIYLRTK